MDDSHQPKSKMVRPWNLSAAILLIVPWFVLGNVCSAAAAELSGTRELGRIRSNGLNEISGIVASRQYPGILWMHNDGIANELYAVHTSGRIAATLHVPGEFTDVEDIAIGPGPVENVDYLYLGDIGDNQEKRSEIKIIRLPEPKLFSGGGDRFAAQDVESFQLTYPERGFDAEALLVDPVTGDVLVVTKQNNRGRVFAAPAESLKDGSSTELQLVANVDPNLISAGDISSDGRRIILRREGRGWLWHRHAGETLAEALQGRPREVPVRIKSQAKNGEAISFTPDADGYFTVSEGRRQPIVLFPLQKEDWE